MKNLNIDQYLAKLWARIAYRVFDSRAVVGLAAMSFKIYTVDPSFSYISGSGVGVRLKVGDKYRKDWRMGSGGGCALPSWGSGACLQKRNQFCAKNYAILSKFWYFFPILQQKVEGLSPSPESGDLSPCPHPCSDAYMIQASIALAWPFPCGLDLGHDDWRWLWRYRRTNSHITRTAEHGTNNNT